MTVFFNEIKRNKLMLIIWTAVLSFMLGVCVIIYPEMKTQMGEITDMFANMGSFSSAFGMDKLNFGEFIGYFGVECGNVLGLGGAFFAAILGISALAGEEKDRTAEFLLTHPISRVRVVTEKLIAAVAEISAMNAAVVIFTLLATLAIGESVELSKILLIFLAYFLMQIEILAITFGISAFLSRGGLGIGIGIAVFAYFINIMANLTEEAKALKYVTPFGYTDSGDIISDGTLKISYLFVGLLISAASIALAYCKYRKKDIK